MCMLGWKKNWATGQRIHIKNMYKNTKNKNTYFDFSMFASNKTACVTLRPSVMIAQRIGSKIDSVEQTKNVIRLNHFPLYLLMRNMRKFYIITRPHQCPNSTDFFFSHQSLWCLWILAHAKRVLILAKHILDYNEAIVLDAKQLLLIGTTSRQHHSLLFH